MPRLRLVCVFVVFNFEGCWSPGDVRQGILPPNSEVRSDVSTSPVCLLGSEMNSVGGEAEFGYAIDLKRRIR